MTLKFADDTCCLESDENFENLIRKINTTAVLFKAHKMATNTGKTQYIIFRAKTKKLMQQPPEPIDNANDPADIPNPNLISPLERYYNNNKNKIKS